MAFLQTDQIWHKRGAVKILEQNNILLYVSGVHTYVRKCLLCVSFRLLLWSRGRGGITARLRFKAPWLENCVRQDCDISHSE